MIEEPSVPNIILDVRGVLRQEILFLRRLYVVKDVPELDVPEALVKWAMRIFLYISKCMMFPVHCNPIPSVYPRGDPQNATEQPIDYGV